MLVSQLLTALRGGKCLLVSVLSKVIISWVRDAHDLIVGHGLDHGFVVLATAATSTYVLNARLKDATAATGRHYWCHLAPASAN